jgi:4'-phosphopantetheinyl transferase EntD
MGPHQPLLETLLPPAVAVVETSTPSILAQQPLLSEEEALLGPRASARRRQDFAAGRACDRQALLKLGVSASAILAGSQQQPIWPPGIVGSITHCAEYCAVAVARATQVVAIGIDAEVNAPMPASTSAQVCSPSEREWIRSAPQSGGVHWETLYFSAKESIYKAWFPLMERWLGFEDVRLTVDPVACAFSAEALPDVVAAGAGKWPTLVHGRYLVSGNLVFTAVTLWAANAS